VTSGDQWLAIIGIAASPLTAVVGFILGYAAQRPRLQLVATASVTNHVAGRDMMLSSVTIYNNPAFIRKWIRVTRQPVNITEARLYDPNLQELVGHPLLWANHGASDLLHEITIESGKQGQLYVFAKDRYSDEYFAYYANTVDSDPPRSPARYTDKRKRFTLVLRDVDGRQFKFRLVVRNTDQSAEMSPRRRLRHRAGDLLRRL
jgi:hypothetical protein